MNILLFGGRGRTGKEIIKQANRHKIIVFEGDITDTSAVNDAMSHIDVVVSVIGHVKGSVADVQTKGIQNVVVAMKKQGVSRIVSLTGSGVRLPGDKITSIDRILNLSISMIDPARVRDGITHAEVLRGSGLDYTIIRVLKLTSGGSSHNWVLTPNGPTKPFTSRSDVASAILQVIEEHSFIQQYPMITKK
jgi:hypothetical protein